jgi:hypothetical protein
MTLKKSELTFELEAYLVKNPLLFFLLTKKKVIFSRGGKQIFSLILNFL